jgi:hypothetical protein
VYYCDIDIDIGFNVVRVIIHNDNLNKGRRKGLGREEEGVVVGREGGAAISSKLIMLCLIL